MLGPPCIDRHVLTGPSKAVPPMQEVMHAEHYDSRDTSVYSQPSPSPAAYDSSDARPDSTPIPGDVSPLSTPRSSVDFNHSDTSLVSPIEPEKGHNFRVPKPEALFRSHIPRAVPEVLLYMTNENEQNPGQAGLKKTETKWDSFSGEPTMADTGKPPTVRPGDQPEPLDMQYPQLKERTRQILANLRAKNAARQTVEAKHPLVKSPDPLDNPIQREPWHGASGRTVLVPPVKNTPDARKGPLKHSERGSTPIDPDRAIPPDSNATPTKSTHTIPRKPSPTSLKTQPLLTIRPVSSEESIRPVVPLKLGNNSPRVRSPTTIEMKNMLPSPTVEKSSNLQSPFQSPPPTATTYTAVTTSSNTDNRQSSPVEREPSPSTRMAPTPTRPPGTLTNEKSSNLKIPHTSSQFSWATYATSVTDSPGSNAPSRFDSSPIPSLPPMPAPILVKKRAASSSVASAPYLNMDAVASNSSITTQKPMPSISSAKSRTASMITTASSRSKSLPQCPPELHAADKITSLEAHMEDLQRRQHNIHKIIKAMNDGLKRNSIVYNFNQIKEAQRKIESLKDELNDVKTEEHETGLLLHRAQRKRDRENNYGQPTGLWIKRVTS